MDELHLRDKLRMSHKCMEFIGNDISLICSRHFNLIYKCNFSTQFVKKQIKKIYLHTIHAESKYIVPDVYNAIKA